MKKLRDDTLQRPLLRRSATAARSIARAMRGMLKAREGREVKTKGWIQKKTKSAKISHPPIPTFVRNATGQFMIPLFPPPTRVAVGRTGSDNNVRSGSQPVSCPLPCPAVSANFALTASMFVQNPFLLTLCHPYAAYAPPCVCVCACTQ